MKRIMVAAALAASLFVLPAEGAPGRRRGCPQMSGVNAAREITRAKMNASRPRTKAGEGQKRYGLIILAQYSDLSFRAGNDRAAFEKIINGSDPASALSYFNAQWDGYYDFEFDITDIVTLPNTYSYYGANSGGSDARAHLMVRDACQKAKDEQHIDFSRYDNDGDGEVDNVFVFYAGPDEAEYDENDSSGKDYIWSHQWYIKDGAGLTFRLDGKLINNYACTAELMVTNYAQQGNKYVPTAWTMASIGTFCHEYTHTFGIPDLYDSNEATGGYAETLWGSIDLMDAGNQNNSGYTPPNYSAVERWFFEMNEPLSLREGEHTLQPVHKNGDFYLVKTDTEGEVYLIEARSNEGWDAYIGGSGLMIYHIDNSSSARNRWDENELNATAKHQCVDAVECDNTIAATYRSQYANLYWSEIEEMIPKVFWPDGGQGSFSSLSQPSWSYWSGALSPVGLTNIRKNGDGSVSFTVVGDVGDLPPRVTIVDQLTLQDASIIRWTAEDFEGTCMIRYKETDGGLWREETVQPYATERYAFVIDGLKARTSYDVEICAVSDKGMSGPVNRLGGFLTKRAVRSGEYPYIYLKGVDRNEDGSFPQGGVELPLRVYNCPEGSVRWYFDAKEIFPSANGYFRLSSSGTLRAVITTSDETVTIVKKINVL